MCEFCLKHDEGKKWYLEAKNYSDDLLSDAKRQKLFQQYADLLETAGSDLNKQMEGLEKAPSFVKRMMTWKTVRTMSVGYSAAQKKSYIDPRCCYGCGICRAVCRKGAIHLRDRSQVPVAANLWS